MAETARLLEYHDLITSVIAALEARDTYTASHSGCGTDPAALRISFSF